MTNFNLVESDFYLIVSRYPGKQGARQKQIISEMSGHYADVVAAYGINTFNRHKHFLAQICEESWGLSMTHELASGAEYQGRKDLGNIHPGDGVKFKGRTLIDLTGRAHYEEYGKILKLDLISHPEQLEVWPNYLTVAGLFWQKTNLNHWADADNLLEITRRINGGTNGLEDRRAYMTRAKTVLNRYLAAAAPVATLGAVERPYLYRRPTAVETAAEHYYDHVEALQVNLSTHGVPLTVDGDFGPATELAVKCFQHAVNLPVTGIVDPATWAELLARP